MRGRALAGVGLAALLVGAFYLSAYALEGHEEPLGFDTSRYLWRNRCVAEGGVRGLRECRPPLATSMPGRVAEPLVVLPARSVLGVSDRAAAAALPAVLATALGLAAAALVTVALRAGSRTGALVAVVTGSSALVARLAGPEGYADNLLALALGTASIALALCGRAGAIAGAVALGAAGLAHWPTFAVVSAVVAGAALLQARPSLRERRSGRALWGTHLGRLGIVVLGGAGMWAVGAIVAGSGPDRFFADPASSGAKLAADVASYVLPVTVPAAALGAVALWRGGGGDRGVLESVLVAWLGVIGLAVAAWMVTPALPAGLRFLGAGFPLHRFLAMALPIPILVALALRWAGRSIRPTAAAVIVVIAGTAAWGWLGYRLWSAQEPFADHRRLADAAVASAYLDRAVPVGTVVVAVVDGVGANPFTDLYQVADNLRVPLDPRRISRTYLYLGRTENLRQGLPTLTGDPGYDAASRFRWRGLSRVLDRPHVVLVMRSYSPEFPALARAMPGRLAGPGVLALTGPAPKAGPAVATPGPLELPEVAWAFLGMVLLMGATGAGWAAAVADLRSFEWMALAPALGAAGLVWTGLLADRVGVRPWGWGGTAIVVAVGTAGAVAARVRRGRRYSLPGSARREST
jgi:hypothetical protein